MKVLHLETEKEVSILGRITLRGGKFDRTFSLVVSEDVNGKILRETFLEIGSNLAVALRIFDQGRQGTEVKMSLWKRCEACKKEFFTNSEVCPNHTGHTLVVMMPQPVPKGPAEGQRPMPRTTPLTPGTVVRPPPRRPGQVGSPVAPPGPEKVAPEPEKSPDPSPDVVVGPAEGERSPVAGAVEADKIAAGVALEPELAPAGVEVEIPPPAGLSEPSNFSLGEEESDAEAGSK